ncbi:Putative monocarboxylate transporter mch1 [Savitreella phatthalungensis]
MSSYSSSRWVSIVAAIITIFAAGFPLTFSLYDSVLQQELGYTAGQVNAVRMANVAGQFVLYPVAGYLCDKCGASRVAIADIVIGAPALFAMAAAYSRQAHWTTMAIAFFLSGVGGNCAYVAALTFCARALPKASAGLAIAVPVCAYSTAALLMSLVFAKFFTDHADPLKPIYDLAGFFTAIGWFTAVATLIGVWGMSTGGPASDADEVETLLPQEFEGQEPFMLQDWTALLFFAGYIIVAGTTETLAGNMSSVWSSISTGGNFGSDTIDAGGATAVATFSAASTFARLLAGVASDKLAVRDGGDRTVMGVIPRGRGLLFVSIALVLTCDFALLSSTWYLGYQNTSTAVASRYLAIVAVNGLAYGALYTTAPTIARSVWGVRTFGANWGWLSYAPLAGSSAFAWLYAELYDRTSAGSDSCSGRACYATAFAIMAGSLLIGAGLWASAWAAWRRRGQFV